MKFNVADTIVHRHQETGYTCGVAAVAMLLGVRENDLKGHLRWTVKGTCNHDVYRFLNNHVAKSHYVHLNEDYYNIIERLTTLSLQYPFYCSGTYLWKNPGRGRPITRHHASLFADGMIYDPAEYREVDPASYETTFNKRLTFRTIIIVEVERRGFLKNFGKHEVAA